jgi:signal transduction histidine kinase
MATDARHLELVTELDESIDKVARQAAWEALGNDPAAFEAHYASYPDSDGMVVGDEMRLRQIITNLAR